METKTGLKYVGKGVIYAFKRHMGAGSFVPLEDLFKLYSKKSGIDTLSVDFVEWFFTNQIQAINRQNFELVIDQDDFDENGIFIGSTDVSKSEENRRHTEERPLKSTQIVVSKETTTAAEELKDNTDTTNNTTEVEDESEDEDVAEETQEVAEVDTKEQASDGMVTVESSTLSVISDIEEAQKALVEEAKKARRGNRDLRDNIVTNIPEKPVKVETSYVITGDDFKKRTDKSSKAVVLDSSTNPQGVPGVDPQGRKTETGDSPFVFTADPAPSTKNVGAGNEVVNYGGKSTRPPDSKAKEETKQPGEAVRGGNVMRQPAQASPEALKSPISVDDIVRNPSNDSALKCIEKCRDTYTLKVARRILREQGTKIELEKAVERRLRLLPAGSV